MNKIITFYSYKGGVGRSMALVNVAVLLSKWGKKVLMIDWDLEAPGLEYFFKGYLADVDWSQQKGLLEYLFTKQNKENANWQDSVISFKTEISTVPLQLLVSGKANGDYTNMLRAFNVSEFYEKHDGGRIIENFRDELLKEYDYILIDSRTGVTDFGGICTVQMPDILVMLFTPTEQGLQGTIKIAKRVAELHKQQPVDRYKLLICPVPSRIDDDAEFQTTTDWFKKIAIEMEFLYEEWLPTSINIEEVLQKIKLPYLAYFSFGEKIPVIEQGMSNPRGLGYAYENLAMLLGKGLDSVDEFVEKREKYLEDVSGQKPVQLELNDTIGSILKCVRVFISFQKNDLSIVEEMKSQIQNHFTNSNVEFVNIGIIPMGHSISKFLKNKINSADIILVMASRSYFSTEDPISKKYVPARDVSDEFYAISNQNEDEKLVVPIYFNFAQRSISKVPQPLSDRHGIDARIFESPSSIVNCILKEIAPIIESIIIEKSRPISASI